MSRTTAMFHLKRDLDKDDIQLLRKIAGRSTLRQKHNLERVEEELRDVYGRDWKRIVGQIEVDDDLLKEYIEEAQKRRLILPTEDLE